MKPLTEYGYKVSVEIVRDIETDTAYVKVIAPMYIVKEWTFTHSYKSSDFSDYEILKDRDFQKVMLNHYPKQ